MKRRPWLLLACLTALLVPACQDEQAVVAPVLSATCEARPSTGTAPLVVSFLLNVSGAEGPITAAISYGDGQAGTNPDAPHTYVAAGDYTASFNVTTSTQNARCSAAVAVRPGVAPASGNQAPTAVFKTTPPVVGSTITGTAPLTVTFNMCASSDPEGDELFFEYDFEGDGKFDFKGITGAHCRADHVYAVGTWVPVICLYDRDAKQLPLHDDICRTFVVVATP